METKYNRFKDAAWFPKGEEHIIVGGGGGIGSWVTLFLARAGFSPIVYDHDRVEEHNLGGQLFKKDDISHTKTMAISRMILNFCDKKIDTYNMRYYKSSLVHNFMIAAFDNMKSRKEMFENWVEYNKDTTVIPLFIDGRLRMEQLQIFCVTPDKIEEYKKHLFNDDEVEDEPCTLKQTSHTAAMIAAHMTAFFTNHITNIQERKKVRYVPFCYEYFTPLSLTEIS